LKALFEWCRRKNLCRSEWLIGIDAVMLRAYGPIKLEL
jgi:hypothetical protein